MGVLGHPHLTGTETSMRQHDCDDYALDRGTEPDSDGKVEAWTECGMCGRTWAHREVTL